MNRASLIHQRLLGLGAIVLAAITLLGVNLFVSQQFPLARADLTAERIYTISDRTRTVLASIDEPIVVRLYFSRALGEAAPGLRNYFERVRALLDHYSDLSGGRLVVEVYNPEPFSDAEDRAVAAGLRGISLGRGDANSYFGLVATNMVDEQETIPLFSPDRESFLEYDLTLLIHKLSTPQRMVIGLISTVPVEGGPNPQTGQPMPPWRVMRQIQDFYEVRRIDADATSIPLDIDALMMIQPAGLPDELLYAIDQFVLAGRPAIVFADPYIELLGMMGAVFRDGDRFLELMKNWGIAFDYQNVVGDAANARRVQFGTAEQPLIAPYLVWLGMGEDSFDVDSPLFANVNRLNFATAGALDVAEGATTEIERLVWTSPLSTTTYDRRQVRRPDPGELLRGFEPGGESMPLMVRITGRSSTLFPAGLTEDEDGPGEGPSLAEGDVNLVIVGDVDMLYDSFWANIREVLGSQHITPIAGNADMVLNAFENLSGGAALAGLRGRTVVDRPFTLVQAIRRDAEERYREQEQTLRDKLRKVQERIDELGDIGDGGEVRLSEEDQETLREFRREMIALRQELRAVQRNLRENIDRLDFWLKFANIAAVPLILIAVGTGALAVRRRSSRARIPGRSTDGRRVP